MADTVIYGALGSPYAARVVLAAWLKQLDFSLQLPGNAVLFVLLIAIALHRAPPAGQKGHRQGGVVAKS